ncbi:phosphatase PAP2 family protein [Peribacillus butanolivorans]|uniref:phosphatase PAP2 family protein n=1 Tax=Peribacillus butanolivorans TaxID=421767 RepID=UPI0036D93E82
MTGYSFTSVHATNAIALYGFLALLIWQYLSSSRTMLIFISAIFILTIGFSRIYLGAHYPSDILGGFFTGGFWLGSQSGFISDIR